MPKTFQDFYKFAKSKGYSDTEIRDEVVSGTAEAFKIAKERNIPREQLEAKIESLDLPPQLYSPPEEAGQHFADKMARAKSVTEKMGDFFGMAKARIMGTTEEKEDPIPGITDIKRRAAEAAVILGVEEAVRPLEQNLGPTAARAVKDATAGVVGTISGFSGAARMAGLETIGESISRYSDIVREELTPQDANFADEVAQGFGSMATFMVPGYGVQAGAARLAAVSTRAAAWLGTSAMATTEAMVEAGSTYNESLKKDPEDKELAQERGNAVFWGNLPVLLVTDKLGFFSDLKPVAGAIKGLGPTGKKLLGMSATAATEGSQEYTQEVFGNIALFEPTLNGAIRAFGVGAIVGGGVRGLIDLQTSAVPEPVTPEVPVATPEVTQEELEEELTERLEREGGLPEEAKITSQERDLSKVVEERKEAQKAEDVVKTETKKEEENLLNVELDESYKKYDIPKEKELPRVPEIKIQEEPKSVKEELPLLVEGLAPKSLGAAAPKGINQEPDEGFWPEAAYRFKDRATEILGLKTPPPQKVPDFSFSESETESRFTEAQKGVSKPTLIQKTREGMNRLWNQSTRFFEHLPRGKKFARISHAFLQFRKKRSVTQDEAIRTIENITHNMDDPMVNLFTRAVVLQDLVQEDAAGKKLPFGFKSETLAKDWSKLKGVIDKTPSLSTALAKRELYWESIKERYITAQHDIGFNVLDRLKKKDYFRHQVLEYAQSQAAIGGARIRTPVSRGFLKKRMGSEMDISANYAQAEFEVMSRMLMDIEIAKVIKMIKTEHDIKDSLTKKAQQQNQENMASKMAQDQNLQQALQNHQGTEDAFMRETLGKEYVEWANIIPEDHAEFQPREGMLFFMVDTIPSGMAQKLQEKIVETVGISRDNVKRMIAAGGKRVSYVIPQELKEQLDAFEQGVSEANPALQLIRDTTKLWKIWQLISPRRFFKYNIRNMTGDSDPTMVGNPQSFKFLPRSAKELIPVMFGNWERASPDVKEWQRLGGFETTLQAQEMGDLEDVKFLSNLFTKSSENIAVSTFKKYWQVARGLTDYREALLRYASYLSYKEQITKGKGKPENYGASIPDEIDALEKTEDKAFRLSNELLGAYDEISETGASLRRDFIPFWSWKEVNFRRYVQMFKNAQIDNNTTTLVGRSLGIKSTVGAARAGKWMLKATAFWSMLQVYNHTRFPDEERELNDFQRNRPHIILGRDPEGNVKYFSGVGAFGDVLAWFGLDAAPLLVSDWLSGKRTAKEVAISMGKAPFNILAQGLTPSIKMPMELTAKQQFYPDVFEPRQMRDRWAYLWQSIGLQKEFNAIYGLPSRGYLKTLDSFFYYKVDPLSGSYYDIQNMKRKFIKKKGREFTGYASTPRSESLYRYKQSLRYGDKDGAQKWLKKYAVLGGTRSGMRRSLMTMHPLHGLRKIERAEFISSFDADDKRKYRNAEKYFSEVLSGKKLN